MKKNQMYVGWIILILSLFFANYQNTISSKLGLFMITGLGMGYVLQRARFGFAGTVKKIFIMGNGELIKAVLLLFIISLIISAGIQYTAFLNGDVIPGISSVKNITLLGVIGGLLFGIGMMFAGGCASGTLTDIGEGYIRSIVVLIFFCIGSVLGVAHLDNLKQTFLNAGPKVYIPDYLGYLGSVIFFLVIYALVYFVVKKYEAKRKDEGTFIEETYEEWEKPMNKIDEKKYEIFSRRTYHKFFVERWSFYIGAITLATFGILVLVTTGKNWGVTTTFTYWGGWILQLFGADLSNIGFFQTDKVVKIMSNGFFNEASSMRNLGLILGSLIAALIAGGLKVKTNMTAKQIISYIIGGLVMGYGARLASGCNAGAFYSSLTGMSLSGIVFGITMTVGGIIGLKIVKKCDL